MNRYKIVDAPHSSSTSDPRWYIVDTELNERDSWVWTKRHLAETTARLLNDGGRLRESLSPWVPYGPPASLNMAVFDDDSVNHPKHYTTGAYEVIDVIEDAKVNYHLGNVLKYILRSEHKNESPLEDLKKARWYLNRHIKNLES